MSSLPCRRDPGLAARLHAAKREPQACAIFSVARFDWSIPQLTSLYICLWPTLLTAIASLWLLRFAWRARARVAELGRAERALGRGREIAPARGPL